MNTTTIPELLAPAGDFEAMRAAVANGADAVYFGLDDFNARHRAENFALESLPETVAFLHRHGVRGYVTLNTLIFANELERAMEYLTALISAGIDAIIVQDLGIVRLIRAMSKEVAIHGSTQMTLTESRGIEIVRSLGVERVIVARELSINEISQIKGDSPMPLEVFVHGALCVAYSGQCLTSEALGGRSANRGQCAQACRQPYDLIVDGEHRELKEKAYLLSPQDLAAWDLTPHLAAAGVCSLKIEGRLKSPQYVAATTQTYRAALDALAAGRPFEIDQQQKLDLAQSFSRGFTHGFLSGINHQELVQGRFPKHRGVKIGTVRTCRRQEVVVDLDPAHFSAPTPPLKPGDGVVFDEGHPEQDEQGGRLYEVHFDPVVNARELILSFGSGAVNYQAIAPGAWVWRTDDPAMRKRLERTYSAPAEIQRTPVRAVVIGGVGRPLTLQLSDETGNSISVTTEQQLAAAIKHPITRPLLNEQLGRLGSTEFTLANVQLQLVDESNAISDVESIPVMVPKSVLNDLRRRAITKLADIRSQSPVIRAIDQTALARLRSEIAARRRPKQITGLGESSRGTTPFLSVLCRTLDQLEAMLNWTPDEGLPPIASVICDFEDVRRSREAVELARSKKVPIALATPRIIKPREEGLLQQVGRAAPDQILVRNLAGVSYFREQFPEVSLVGDYSLNVTNDITADFFLSLGLVRIVPGYDLNLEQLLALLSHTDPSVCEIVLHQHVPMFHMEHCVYSHVLSNGRDSHDCGRPCDRHQVNLRDHVGEAHPLQADVGCRNTVFNARAQSAAPYVPQLLEAGVRHFRVELLRETPTEAIALLNQYSLVLAGRANGPNVWHQLKVFQQVGITRGTLEFA